MIHSLQDIWQFISERGVKASRDDEKEMTLWLNRVSFLSAIGPVLPLIGGFFLPMHPLYILILAVISILYGSILVVHHFGKIRLGRFIIVLISPLWYMVHTLLFGGFISQSIASVATLSLTYLFFEREIRIRNILLCSHIIVYAGILGYVAFFGGLVPFDLPGDEIVVYLVSLCWLSLVFIMSQSQKEKLIRNLVNNNRELNRAKEELQRFNYIASHDLKTPLRNIVSHIGLAEMKLAKDKEVNEEIEYVKEGATRMNALLEDIMKISTLTESEGSLRSCISLNEVAQHAVANLSSYVSSRNAEIAVGDLGAMEGNTAELTIVFQNLIQNGIKFNQSARPLVRITAEHTYDEVVIRFEDNGIGIDKTYQEQIFEYFKRLYTQEEYEGTGLGLGLCKRIVEGYGGSINISSRVGSGSIFSIAFPIVTEAVDLVR